MRRRAALVFAIACAALACTGSRAEEWPSRPLRVVIPLSPGSAADIIPRIVFEQLSTQLRQPIIIENKPGASGTIAAHAVAGADPDGYTLLAHSSAHIIAPSTVANLQYDPIKDFAAVAPLGNLPSVLVIAPAKNIKTVQELVAEGKKRTITFGSIGVGSPITMTMERFRLSAGFNAQAITFKGAPEAIMYNSVDQLAIAHAVTCAGLG